MELMRRIRTDLFARYFGCGCGRAVSSVTKSSSAADFRMKPVDQNSPPVRAARTSDATQIASLARQLLVYEKSLNETMGELTPWAADADEMRRQILRPNTKFFVAEKEGEIAGYIKVVLHGRQLARDEIGTLRWLIDLIENSARKIVNFILRRPRPNVETAGGYIAGVFVRSNARRAKVGQSLVEAAEQWLRGQGITTMELHVLHSNEGARRFWEKEGYEPLTLGMRKRMRDEG
jgi:GNAT superfamily N-acetyltransferase